MDVKPLLEWSDEKLSVGLQEIDEQHKVLVALINRLHEAIVTQHEDDEIRDILNELVQYTVIHFAVEESLMRIFHYPAYEEHKRHHEDLTRQVIEIKKKIDSGEEKVSLELLNFLRHWLTTHIMGEDKRYGPFLVSQGLKPEWQENSWADKIWKFIRH